MDTGKWVLEGLGGEGSPFVCQVSDAGGVRGSRDGSLVMASTVEFADLFVCNLRWRLSLIGNFRYTRCCPLRSLRCTVSTSISSGD